MADNFFSLNTVSTGYSVFERDQVLSHDQLNRVTDYLDDQGRLTRVGLLGVGLVGGLGVSLADGKVTVRRGVGVTTDGDLLMLAADTVFDHGKPYDESMPVYPPFYSNNAMRPVVELLVLPGDDVRARPLTELPGLAEMVVVMLMESYKKDPDLCSGSGCDNLGCDVVNACRFLLVSQDLAGDLLASPSTAGSAALKLPELSAERPSIGKSVSSPNELAASYRRACRSTHQALAERLPSLHAELRALTNGLFGGDPAPAWTARLIEYQSAFRSDSGIQYYYDFLKDVVDTWNELREALLADDSLLCPAVSAFPKHLLLGSLSSPAQFRTGFFPSPLAGGGRAEGERAVFLARKLDQVIRSFSLRAAGTEPIRVTPSHSEAASLEDRAIPYYYPATMAPYWNFRLSRRNAADTNLGYDTSHTGGFEVLNHQIGRYEFFRIEGHLGQKVNEAKAAIEKAIVEFNLPFVVRAVLLHDRRDRLVVKPPIRYSDLHRLHYLLRSDIASQLQDNVAFSVSVAQDISEASNNNSIPTNLRTGATRNEVVELANATRDGLQAASSTLLGTADQPGPLTERSYQAYARLDNAWKRTLAESVDAAGRVKAQLGHVMRTDLVSPFDSLHASKHAVWLDWIDMLNKQREDAEDERLLFRNFVQVHPGLEHFGGVTRGGTFVLIYDADARVVADLMLPYAVAEADALEPDEPVLPRPPVRLPVDAKPIKVVKPIERLLTETEERIKPKWNDQVLIQKEFLENQIKIQQGYFNVVKDSLEIVQKNPGVRPSGFSDLTLENLMNDIELKRKEVERTRELVINPATPEETRRQAIEQLSANERELAGAISRGSLYVVQQKMSMGVGADGSKALAVIAEGMDKVSTREAIQVLRTGLEDVSASTDGPVREVERIYKMKGF